MIGSFAADVLAAAAAALDDPPERQYVAHGEPAGDLCEELVVWVDPVVDAAIPPSPVVIHQATVHVDLTRCHPTITPGKPVPPADDLNTAAVDLADEAWTIWRALTAAWRNKVDPFEPCQTVTFVELVPRGPEGGFATWRATIRATITPTTAA